MSNGIDFAWGTLNIPAFMQTHQWVARYLAPTSEGKEITPAEAARYKAANLPFVIVFEDGASNGLGGAAQGHNDGLLAAQQASALGVPTSTPIYISFDFDVSAAQLPTCIAYTQAFVAASGWKSFGAYGSTYLIAALQRAKLIIYGWQCESGGYTHDPTAVVHIKQTGTGGTAWGVSYDDDISLATDFGQYPSVIVPVPVPTPISEVDMSVSPVLSFKSGQVDVIQVANNEVVHYWEVWGTGKWNSEVIAGPTAPTVSTMIASFPAQTPQISVVSIDNVVSVEDSNGAVWVFSQANTPGGGWGANKL